MNARPRKQKNDIQSSRVVFTCTKAEEKEIRALAKAHGFNQHSVFARLACLGRIQIDRTKIENKEK
jgi:hypothetical protein